MTSAITAPAVAPMTVQPAASPTNAHTSGSSSGSVDLHKTSVRPRQGANKHERAKYSSACHNLPRS
jgi:hypothetical protein